MKMLMGEPLHKSQILMSWHIIGLFFSFKSFPLHLVKTLWSLLSLNYDSLWDSE